MAGLELEISVSTSKRDATTDHDLLSLSKVVGRILIQPHNSQGMQRGKLLGDDLGRVQDIEAKLQRLVLVNDLSVELPLWIVPRSNRIPEIRAMVVGVLASNVLRLVPDQTCFALLGLPVPLDELRATFVRDEAKSVNTKTVLFVLVCSASFKRLDHTICR